MRACQQHEDETKFTSLEEKRPDALEMATQAHQERTQEAACARYVSSMSVASVDCLNPTRIRGEFIPVFNALLPELMRGIQCRRALFAVNNGNTSWVGTFYGNTHQVENYVVGVDRPEFAVSIPKSHLELVVDDFVHRNLVSLADCAAEERSRGRLTEVTASRIEHEIDYFAHNHLHRFTAVVGAADAFRNLSVYWRLAAYAATHFGFARKGLAIKMKVVMSYEGWVRRYHSHNVAE